MEEVALAEGQFLVGAFGVVVVESFDHLVRSATFLLWDTRGGSLVYGVHRGVERRENAEHTFFGGKIAIADLGVMEMWWCLGSFSPFKDRLMA